MHAVLTGNISFILINIPVKLYKATEDHGVHFRNLCPTCKNPLHQRRWCTECQKDVAYEKIEKGFPLENDLFAVFTKEELDAVGLDQSKTVKIDKCVDVAELSPVAFEGFYLLVPEKGAEQTYALLEQALSLQKRVLKGKFVMRNKEHLCAIQPHDGGLLLITLHYAEELHPVGELVSGEYEASQEELRLATELLDKLSGPFSCEDYRNTYRDRIMQLVELKEQGKEIVAARPSPRAEAPKDLMAELRKSLRAIS